MRSGMGSAPSVTIAAAPTTITSAASAIRASSTSPPIAQPASTATTGLTKACVDTCAGDVTLNSQVYAANAIIEPKITR